MTLARALVADCATVATMSTAVRQLVVMTVYFGPLPPWLPLTLHSMAANAPVDFVIVGDATPPPLLPPNVRFETIGYEAMQARLSQLTGRHVSYTNTYKANDIKPLLPELYPEAVRGYEWWGWADLDVVFGDLLKFLTLAQPRPACCKGLEINCKKRDRRDRRSPCFNSSRPMVAADTYFDRHACPCTSGEVVTAVSPLYPNPWRKKCWGPFTLFRVSAGARLYRETPKWRDALATAAYTHFDEWWGPFVQQGFESMGDVMTRLSDEGRLVMSRALLPFSEAKSCVDIECTFCPCGAERMTLHGRTLLVNGQESMILHLAESKPGWQRVARTGAAGGVRATDAAGASAAGGGWALPPYAPLPAGHHPCFEVRNLGAFAADPALALVGGVAAETIRYERHRPLSARAASALTYPKYNGSDGSAVPALTVHACTGHGEAAAAATTDATAATTTGAASLPAAISALAELNRRYERFTADEQRRTLSWLCAWEQLSTK